MKNLFLKILLAVVLWCALSNGVHAADYSIFLVDGSGNISVTPSNFTSPIIVDLVGIAAAAAGVWLFFSLVCKFFTELLHGLDWNSHVSGGQYASPKSGGAAADAVEVVEIL